jgi:hypothetical protein
MKVRLEAIYHNKESGKPEIGIDLLTRNEHSIPYRLWLLPRYWPQLKLTLVIELKEAKVSVTESSTFTVEARMEGVGEAFAEALAVRLASMGMTVRIRGKGEDE